MLVVEFKGLLTKDRSWSNDHKSIRTLGRVVGDTTEAKGGVSFKELVVNNFSNKRTQKCSANLPTRNLKGFIWEWSCKNDWDFGEMMRKIENIKGRANFQ